jgi:hypothetical protein
MKLEINKEKAKKLYPKSDDWFKAELEEVFGKDCFRRKDFRDIKTFEDACKELEITNDSCREIFSEEEDPDEIAYKKLKVIIKAINQGWIPNWNNSNEKKWWPYFNLSSGFGFSCSDCTYDYSFSSVGSRLCFESQEKAEYAGQQFLDLYKEFLTLTN